MTEPEPEKERILLFAVYSQGGKIHADIPDDVNIYELFGFLECHIKNMEKELREIIQKK